MSDIYNADYTSLVPPSIKNDPQINALSKTISEQLQITANKIYKNIIYARIDELDENVLDIIAYDLHIDWYDFNYPVDIKRAIIKNSVRVHKRLGTKFAVETAMRDVYPGSYVEEWFEYGGRPYTFRVILDVSQTGFTPERFTEFLFQIRFYKNLRSHPESINFKLRSNATMRVGAYAKSGVQTRISPFTAKKISTNAKLRTGAYTKSGTHTRIYPLAVREISTIMTIRTGIFTRTAQYTKIYPLQGGF